MKLCPQCETENFDGNLLCKNCGFNLNNKNPCPQCNKPNSLDSEFCGNCGSRMSKTIAEFINTSSHVIQNLLTQKAKLHADITSLTRIQAGLKGEIDKVNQYVEDRFNQLEAFESEKNLADLGFYTPRYIFESSEKYRLKLESIRSQQKNLVTTKKAAYCESEWTVNGSRVEGRKQIADTIKLMLFAFNGEADIIITKVKYNNLFESQKRIQKVFDLVNKLTATQQCRISQDYLDLKFEELFLSYEYQGKIHVEKEEQRRIKEQMREEAVAIKEFERARIERENAEERYNNALEKARQELEDAGGRNISELENKIVLLEARLAEASANKERAIARAQMTRSGVVYIISNIGSFGEGVFKIGMTRRLDPMDRVIELGDASVPFRFDVHALIYCDDAPTLENQLHQRFQNKRINHINLRKEFFKISIQEIIAAVNDLHGEVEILNFAEATEYRKSIGIERA